MTGPAGGGWGDGDAPGAPDLAAMMEGNALVSRVRAELERFAHGSDLAQCPELASLFNPRGTAALALASTFTAIGMAALAAAGGNGLSQVMERIVDAEAQVLLLAEGAARLLLVVHGAQAGGAAVADAIVLRPVETWRHFLAGRADGEAVRCIDPGQALTRIEVSAQPIGPGLVMHQLGLQETLHLAPVAQDVVELRLERDFAASLPVRRYRRQTGERIDGIDADHAETRQIAAAAALGQMGRRDAVPPLVAIAGSKGGAESLRRHALDALCRLDEQAGSAVCERIARTRDDPLRDEAARRLPRRRGGLGRRVGRLGGGGLPWFG